jgi:hypothetical protein
MLMMCFNARLTSAFLGGSPSFIGVDSAVAFERNLADFDENSNNACAIFLDRAN